MAPRRVVKSLLSQSMNKLVLSIQEMIHKERSLYYIHHEKTNHVTEFIRQEVKDQMKIFLCETLPSDLQTKLISELIYLNSLASPHLVLDLLFTERLRKFTFELTKKSWMAGGNELIRVSEEDISRCLNTLDSVLGELGGENLSLEQFYIIDKSQDPDFQGDPINNMTNTNLSVDNKVGDWAGIMTRLSSLSGHLSLAPNLTHVVLPFASDQILEYISRIANLILFQNVYRSTVTELGILAIAEGRCRFSLTHIVLCLNTHANVPSYCVSRLLLAATRLRVLEFGGSCHTKSLYFQGGDAKRRHEIFNVVSRLGEDDKSYTNSLVRMLIFREGNLPVSFQTILNHSPLLSDLTLFGWETIKVNQLSWMELSRNLVTLELIGIGFNTDEVLNRNLSQKFDCSLFSEALSLKTLKIAGWGDTQVPLDTLLRTLPKLRCLYLEDIKVSFDIKFQGRRCFFKHDLSSLCIFHCSTSNLNLIQVLCSALPLLKELTVSSLYLDDPNRGLPFHFHMPGQELGQSPRSPVADLQVIAELEYLETLHLNVTYPSEHLEHDFTLPVLLIRKFPRLTHLYLDNYISRRGSVLSYTFDRKTSNNRLQWFLDQYNRNISVLLN